MDHSTIAVRYSKAIFEVALNEGLLEQVKNDFDNIGALHVNNEFVSLLKSKTVQPSYKKKFFDSLFGKTFNKITLQFLYIVIESKREDFIPGICLNFLSRYYSYKNIKKAKLTTAIELNDITKQKIETELGQKFNAKIELTTQSDTNIIGGYILQIDDNQIDASIANKLKQLKKTFNETII